MLTFCPNCSNMLIISRVPAANALDPLSAAGAPRLVDATDDDALPFRFECRSCPYQYLLEHAWSEKKRFARKKAEDVLGGQESWENVGRTAINCADNTCAGREAYFMQVQIRSADEPMTNFYKCVVCAKEWRD